ncbi:MAG: TolC family protein [Elusimicrobiota bacterium]|nr:TolC family protein [Elusimicrobiota bacterium]
MKKYLSVLLLLLLFGASNAYSEIISLNDYLRLVVKNNLALKAINANINSLNGQLAALDAPYSAAFKADGTYAYDNSQSSMQLPIEIKAFSYDASVNKMFRTGTVFAVGFNNSFTSYGNTLADRQVLSPYIQLQQSLIKNLGASATESNIEQARATIRQTLYQLDQSRRQLITGAKLAYWNLSYAKTSLSYKRSSLERSSRIFEWTQNRYKLDLAEKADWLQSQASVKSGELNVRNAIETEVENRMKFNQYIDADPNSQEYDVEDFETIGQAYINDKKLVKTGTRLDVLAASEAVKGASLNKEYSKLSSGADLAVVAQGSLNGVDKSFSDAFGYVGRAERPAYSIGLQYSLPLDFSLREAKDKGYEAAVISKQRSLEAAILQETIDWQTSLLNWENASARLKLAIEVKNILSQYNDENHILLRRGRTTTNTAIQGEQSLDDAATAVCSTIIELITVYENAAAYYTTRIIN